MIYNFKIKYLNTEDFQVYNLRVENFNDIQY